MTRQPRLQNERGAILIHVAIALIALLAFTSFVVDYGLMWVSRRQAQNVVDAGALAGAGAYIFGGDPTTAAQHFAGINPIWGQGNSDANVDVTLSDPATPIPPCGVKKGCVRVDVFRNTPDRNAVIRGAIIPVYFARLVGLNDQGVRATATAKTSSGNLVRCMLPFAVADRWADNTDLNIDTSTYANDGLTGTAGWSPNDKYEGAPAPGLDTYQTPSASDPGTGWTVTGDYGRQLVLKKGDVGQFSSGWANKVDLPGSVGSNDYRDDIRGCNPAEVGIAKPGQNCSDPSFPNNTTTLAEAKVGCLGVASGLTVGPTKQGVQSGGPPGPPDPVVAQDPGAHWSTSVANPISPTGVGGVVDSSGALDQDSARIRPIAVFDIAHYMNNPACVNQAGTGCIIRVANIIGFFVEGMCPTVKAAGQLAPGQDCSPNPAGNNEVVGRIVTLPSSVYAGAGDLDENASFLKVLQLVR